jgi:hypothetical protein
MLVEFIAVLTVMYFAMAVWAYGGNPSGVVWSSI